MWWIIRGYRKRAEQAERAAERITHQAKMLRLAALEVEAENRQLLAENKQQRELLDLLFEVANDGLALAQTNTDLANRYQALMQLRHRPSDN